MAKGLSGATKRNRIADYMASLPEEFEVIEDNLIDSEPIIILRTKSRVITLYCDEKGNVVEEFEMVEGAGSKEDFLLKQEAYNAIRAYYNDYYTGAKIKKSSFEEGIIKFDLVDRTVTLTYDSVNKTVEESDRAKRKPKEKPSSDASPAKEDFGQISLFDLEPPVKKEQPKSEAASIVPQVDSMEGDKTYKKILEGTVVTNVCNNKQYKVKKDIGNIIEVFDKDYGYLMMARADLKIENI